ncbi:MAG TPA: MgtC/SapB family protein [Puia sp.]|jgi:putative Mg2+ transporter-C (MgtC) family protein|nr:MgtC/SapB family protein [Puia sp.]
MNTFQLTPWETIARLSIAAVLGSVIGFERQRKDGPAGLRTHMLVCLGSALVMLVSAFGFEDILGRPAVVLDPSRIAAQVISGIGFLGAGTIIFLRPRIIRGLTTAAGLWTVAAIGLAVGAGLYIAATASTVIALLILAVIKPLEKRMPVGRRKQTITVIIDTRHANLSGIQSSLKKYEIDPRDINLTPGENEGEFLLSIDAGKKYNTQQLLSLIAELKALGAAPTKADSQ